MTDRRTRESRDAEVIEQIRKGGGLSTEWLKRNRTRPAAFDRVLAAGLIEVVNSEPPFMRYRVAKKPWWARLIERFVGRDDE